MAHNHAYAIAGGQPESGYPSVGLVGDESITIGDCTGTLIDPYWIVTASHCHELQGFVLGAGLGSFEQSIQLDVKQTYLQPSSEVTLIHLATPIEDIEPSQLGNGEQLEIGQTCTAVGYGLDGYEPSTGMNRFKRSAEETVVESGKSLVTLAEKTGIARGGDSGGPLFCDGELVAVAIFAADSLDGPSPYRATTYNMIDPEWVTQTIANAGGAQTASPSGTPDLPSGTETAPLLR